MVRPHSHRELGGSKRGSRGTNLIRPTVAPDQVCAREVCGRPLPAAAPTGELRAGRPRSRMTESMGSVQRFYDERAETYDSELSDDRATLLRRAFWDLVGLHAPAGCTILDLGCGTGVDAVRYAESGFDVLAHDVSPGMLDVLVRRCRAVSPARVTTLLGEEALRAALPRRDVKVLTANFAVLNLLADLQHLSYLVREGLPELRAVVVSVLNPFFVRDIGRPWWWRGLWRSRFKGPIDTCDGGVHVRRYTIAQIQSALGLDYELRNQVSFLRGHTRRGFPLNRMGHLRLLAFVRS